MGKRRPLDDGADEGHAEKSRKLGEGGSLSVQTNVTEPKLNNEDYTVGWICALVTEYVAAQALLDDKHGTPDWVSPNDKNNYTLGQMGKHKVVIAVLPDVKYGTASAATVASDMMHSFRNVRIGLMVGIAGGAPSHKRDIRLGDIVVSSPQDSKPGVICYDFGKNIQGKPYQQTGVLNQPPLLLRAAVSGFKAEYEADGHCLEDKVEDALRKKPRLRKKYSRPDADSDRLYAADALHPATGELDCIKSCGNESSKLVARPARDDEADRVLIHYGNIASGNTLMKNAEIRDTLSEQQDILCFEMEAAGLMDGFPCLVIRGICDYSDSHKSKEWQGYAAMVAAAYAKDLLSQIVPSKVEAETRIVDFVSVLTQVAEDQLRTSTSQLRVAEEHLQMQRDIAKDQLSKEEQCHQLFRLASDARDATYEWYKERVEKCVDDTCLWFLNHQHFRQWLERDSGPLVVSADPGCGKSVLAKYLIDHVLPRSATVCYFFFKDQDQNTVRQALCAVLHQLFSQLPFLIKHAMPKFHANGKKLIYSTNSLWQILQDAASDPDAGSIIIVFDALDECEDSEFDGLVQRLTRQFEGGSQRGSLRYLMTCRPYEQIVSEFNGLRHAFPYIRVPGEDESEAISREIDRVITYRVALLKQKKRLSDPVRNHLECKLKANKHRTYLWIYLVFDYLESQNFRKTENGISQIIATLPRSVTEAYEKILSRCDPGELPMVRKALSMTLAAARPLKLDEMNIALNINMTTKSLVDLDLEATADFKARLRSACGLFLSIHHNQVYFLHQTAREFLLRRPEEEVAMGRIIDTNTNWHHSFIITQAHDVLACACVCFLGFSKRGTGPSKRGTGLSKRGTGLSKHSTGLAKRGTRLPHPGSTNTDNNWPLESDIDSFLGYAAVNWVTHFREAEVAADAPIMAVAVKICDVSTQVFQEWSALSRRHGDSEPLFNISSSLELAIHHEHFGMVQRLLKDGADVGQGVKFSRALVSPLGLASRKGEPRFVHILLKGGARVDGGEEFSEAVHKGHTEVARLLLAYGAKANRIGGPSMRTPLADAVRHGNDDIVDLIRDHGVEIDSRNDQNSLTAFLLAVLHEDIVLATLLLDRGASVKTRTPKGDTALHITASRRGNIPLATLLLNRGANIKAKTLKGDTALHIAASKRNVKLATLLLDRGADIEAQDNSRRTALQIAGSNKDVTLATLLLDRGANVGARDKSGRTALHIAASHWGKAVQGSYWQPD